MRPRGEIRMLLRAGFAERGACTWREMLPCAQVDTRSPAEVRLVRKTVENMVAAGELVKVGVSREAGARVWQAMYEAAPPPDAPAAEGGAGAALDALQSITRGWIDFV